MSRYAERGRSVAAEITQSPSSFRIVTSATRSSTVDTPLRFVDESLTVSVTAAVC